MPSAPHRETWLHRARLPARLGYVVILLFATLVPFTLDPDAARVAERLAAMLHPTVRRSDVVDGARNLVLFAGWGVTWALTAGGGVRRIVAEATLTGALISLTVESLQLFSSNRNASLLDVSTNTAGALLGSFGLILLVALVAQRRRARSFVGVPALLFASGYGISALAEMLTPLFRSDTIIHGPPLERVRFVFAAFSAGSLLDLPWTDLPIFFPAGALAVAALAEHGTPYARARWQVIGGGTLLALAAELLHAVLGESMVGGAVLLHVAGLTLGAWAAARWLPRLTLEFRGAARPRALALAYMAALAAWSWRPFLPEVELSQIVAKVTREWYIPLAELSLRPDFFSVADVCGPFFRFLPLGGLLAVWPWRTRGWLGGPWPALWLAVLLEAGQIVVLGRLMNLTDMLIPAAGALVGWTIVRRAGYPVYGQMGR